MKKSNAFTLAEVLTTLMVIGVVAAMTIPTLMNSTTEQQNKVAYKKALSVLGQGIQLMAAKEDQCIVGDSNALAECFKNKVIHGTLKDNVIKTSDGMSYMFLYSGTLDEDERTLEDICGYSSNVFTSENADGTSALCAVIVDLNGSSKGAKSFPATSGRGIKASILGIASKLGEEQQPIMISGNGVRPMYFSGSNGLTAAHNVTVLDNGNYQNLRVEKSTYSKLEQGWKWIYGDTATP